MLEEGSEFSVNVSTPVVDQAAYGADRSQLNFCNMFGTLGLGLGLGLGSGSGLGLLGTLSRYYCAHSHAMSP